MAKKFPSMPETEIQGTEGEVRIHQKQDGVDDVVVWFPAQMADAVIAAIKAAAQEAHDEAPPLIR